jgi:hypothetical protein
MIWRPNPNVFDRWQKEFFEHGSATFERRSDGRERKPEQKVEALVRNETLLFISR